MDLGPTQKPPVRIGGLSSKQLMFLGIAGVILVVGVVLRNVDFSGEPDGEETAPVAVEAAPSVPAEPMADTAPVVKRNTERLPTTAPATQEAATPPSPPVEQSTDAAQQTGEAAEPSLPGEDMLLVARRPVELLASPSADASVMFGFPAGRPFRVIGEEGGFVQIRDEKSGASGWIDKSALAAAPPRVPVVTTRSRPKPDAGGRRSSPKKPDAGGRGSSPKRNARQTNTSIGDELESTVKPPKRPGLFGGDGLLGGIFRK
ncbi:MAG: SH3 domain-containing protein [Hyphomicrobiaceae bacterium]|nr:SH3 domain-containing protein [Hyphomicrobiaceae bacterium]MDX2448949.1 SH3 domain-containing protein [Hyphomicrobiaceae bacterium]